MKHEVYPTPHRKPACPSLQATELANLDYRASDDLKLGIAHEPEHSVFVVVCKAILRTDHQEKHLPITQYILPQPSTARSLS